MVKTEISLAAGEKQRCRARAQQQQATRRGETSRPSLRMRNRNCMPACAHRNGEEGPRPGGFRLNRHRLVRTRAPQRDSSGTLLTPETARKHCLIRASFICVAMRRPEIRS